jgi:dienelactone hydrolase
MRLGVLACLAFLAMVQPATAEPGVVLQTSVTPQAGDDLAADCRYELTVLDPAKPIKAVWVIFDRGRDMLRYYGDPDVHAFALRHDWALLLPFHCPAKSYEGRPEKGEMHMDPAQGLGRALFAALTQLAERARHPELTTSPLILLGFSGTGSLVARFTGYAPERIAAVIASGPGHFEPLGMDTIDLASAASAIPQLVIAGSADAITGTSRPYAYFKRHFERGAPWTFVVQNAVPHCCIINAKALVLRWLDAVVIQRLTRARGSYGFVKTAPSTIDECPKPYPPAKPIWCSGTKDSWGGENWTVSAATVANRDEPPRGMLSAGWLPTPAFAKEWRAFVTKAKHPITSLP